jgi:hypothetical protein
MRILAWTFALVALAITPAWADVLTVSATAAGTVGGDPFYSGPQLWYADLPQFDSSLGTLDSVEFSVDAWHNGTFAFQAVAARGRVRVDYIDYSFEVNAFGGTGGNLIFEPWVTTPTPEEPFGLPPGHWSLPLTPWIPAGEGVGPLPFGTERAFDDTYVPADPELVSFIGTGTLPIEIRDWAVFGITTYGTSTAWQLNSECGIYVEATYNYTVPEPSALALLAFSGLLAIRRRP